MPKYEYKCPQCGYKWEEKVGFNDPTSTDPSVRYCPKCKIMALKVYTAPLVVYKAKGFYSTDNKDGKND